MTADKFINKLSSQNSSSIELLTLISCIILTALCLSGCQSENATLSIKETPANAQPRAISVSGSEINASEPALAADESGTIYSVYVEHYADKFADVYLQKFDSNKQPQGEKVRVNPEKGQAQAWFGDPPTIQIGKDDAIYIGWTARFENREKPSANILYLSASRNGGVSFEAPVKVNDDVAPAAHGMHSLAIDDNNRVYLAWLDERSLKSQPQAENHQPENQIAAETEFEFIRAHHNSNQNNKTKIEKPALKEESAEPNSEVYYAVSSDDGRTFAANKKLSSEVCPCCKTHLLAASDKRVYVSWRQVLPGDFRHIAVATLTDNGNNFSAPVIVSDDQWQISACPVSGAPMIMAADNVLKIAWFTAGNAGKQGIYSTESKDGGKTFAPRVLISENAASGTPVLLTTNGIDQIVWAEAGKILTAKLGANTSIAESRQEIGEGELPAATLNREQVYVGYVKKQKEQRGVWLSSIKK